MKPVLTADSPVDGKAHRWEITAYCSPLPGWFYYNPAEGRVCRCESKVDFLFSVPILHDLGPVEEESIHHYGAFITAPEITSLNARVAELERQRDDAVKDQQWKAGALEKQDKRIAELQASLDRFMQANSELEAESRITRVALQETKERLGGCGIALGVVKVHNSELKAQLAANAKTRDLEQDQFHRVWAAMRDAGILPPSGEKYDTIECIRKAGERLAASPSTAPLPIGVVRLPIVTSPFDTTTGRVIVAFSIEKCDIPKKSDFILGTLMGETAAVAWSAVLEAEHAVLLHDQWKTTRHWILRRLDEPKEKAKEPEKCPHCKGDGYAPMRGPYGDLYCPKCNGTGEATSAPKEEPKRSALWNCWAHHGFALGPSMTLDHC